MQPWALVSPASRGIGLELARRLLLTTKVPIVATARNNLDQTRENILHGLDGVSEDRLHVLKIDVLGRCSYPYSDLRKIMAMRHYALQHSYNRATPVSFGGMPSHISQTKRQLPTRPHHYLRPSPKSPPTSTSPWPFQASCIPKRRPVKSTMTMPSVRSKPTLSAL